MIFTVVWARHKFRSQRATSSLEIHGTAPQEQSLQHLNMYEYGRQFLQTTAHEPSHALTSRVVFNNERTQLNAPTGQHHVFQKLLRDNIQIWYWCCTSWWPKFQHCNLLANGQCSLKLSVIARHYFCTRSSEILAALMLLPTIHPAFNRFRRVAHGRGDVPGIAEKYR